MPSKAGRCLKNQCLDSLHFSYAQSGNRIPKRDTVPAVSDICASGFIRRCSPSQRAISNSGGWLPLHGSCTPPRISPSCPHYVPLWLDRRTIVRGQDHCEAACQSCFWMDGYRSSPSWAVFIQEICTGGLRASSASLFHFWLVRLMSFQSLDMYFSSCTRRTEKVPSLLIGIKSRLFTTSFEKFFNFRKLQVQVGHLHGRA